MLWNQPQSFIDLLSRVAVLLRWYKRLRNPFDVGFLTFEARDWHAPVKVWTSVIPGPKFPSVHLWFVCNFYIKYRTHRWTALVFHEAYVTHNLAWRRRVGLGDPISVSSFGICLNNIVLFGVVRNNMLLKPFPPQGCNPFIMSFAKNFPSFSNWNKRREEC